MPRRTLTVLFVTLFASLVFGAQEMGHFVREDCGSISSPVAHSTLCLQTTAVRGRSAGTEYVWNGSAWAISNTAYYADKMGSRSVDCTGATDSSAKLQAIINAVPDHSKIKFPLACIARFDSVISITDRTGIALESEVRAENNYERNAPQFLWNGAGGAMFSVQYSRNITFRGFVFKTNPGKSIEKFIDFDGYVVGHIGTAGVVENNSFSTVEQNNSRFKAISISATVPNNHENYQIKRNSFYCSGSAASMRSRVGSITRTSRALTCANCRFTARDAGKRLRVSYSAGMLDTRITKFIDSTHVEMAAAAGITESNATVHIGEAYGIAIYNGPSPNAKHQRIEENTISQCAVGIQVATGSVNVYHLGGGSNDVDVELQVANSEPTEISYLETEHSMRGILKSDGAGILELRNYRISNDSQQADGFLKIDGQVTIINSKLDVGIGTNMVLFKDVGTGNIRLISVGNNYSGSGGTTTYANVGFPGISPTPISLRDRGLGSNPADSVFGGALFSISGSSGEVIGGTGKAITTAGSPTAIGWRGTTANNITTAADFIGLQGLMDSNTAAWNSLTAVDAALGSLTNSVANRSIYSFRANGPTSIDTATSNAYGLYIGKHKINNIRNGYGVYQADSADKNYFAGPTQFGGGNAITKHISATASLDFGAIPANSCSTLTMTVNGAVDGDTVSLGVPNRLASLTGVTFIGFVSAANTVTVKACNATTSVSADPFATAVRADVWQH